MLSGAKRQRQLVTPETVYVITELSGAEDVVDFERPIELAEPLGPIGCSAPTALFQRQFQLAQQFGDLLTRRDVAHARTGAQSCLIEVVKRGKSPWKELAIHRAFGETIDRPEAKPERQILETIGDELFVARAQHRQSIADHDPITGYAVELAALAPGVLDHLRIVARAGHGIG